MSTMQRIRDGLDIFLKYQTRDHYDCAAEHDVLMAGSIPPEQLTPEDRARLEELRWRWKEGEKSWEIFV